MRRSRRPAGWSDMAVVACAVATVSTAACQAAPESADMGTPPATPEATRSDPEVAAAIDSGSVAFRAGDYEAALHHYTRAAESTPGSRAAWFGVYMAERALAGTGSEGAGVRAGQALDRARAAH